MMTIIKIVNTGPRQQGAERLWLGIAEPMTVGPELVMTIHADREIDPDDGGEQWVPRVSMVGPGASFHEPVPPRHWVRAIHWARMYIQPRAIEFTGRCPDRVLVDLIRLQHLGRAC